MTTTTETNTTDRPSEPDKEINRIMQSCGLETPGLSRVYAIAYPKLRLREIYFRDLVSLCEAAGLPQPFLQDILEGGEDANNPEYGESFNGPEISVGLTSDGEYVVSFDHCKDASVAMAFESLKSTNAATELESEPPAVT
ncbi:hypothetical protein [Fuerstiella marisgermanici]|uniref:Uncharacterized protein n=1 Tax=Fuerstiella marisgermanici TaxID=1891926 RepID=A0A1P8WDK6_9PLAN|nr:hypothetical protein [Fuerstiella marisgermanici]APZ92129.1 hypothetical protein Fuma_01734 [Fuerstiella marisgermanici]